MARPESSKGVLAPRPSKTQGVPPSIGSYAIPPRSCYDRGVRTFLLAIAGVLLVTGLSRAEIDGAGIAAKLQAKQLYQDLQRPPQP